jgi:hypothetical protein
MQAFKADEAVDVGDVVLTVGGAEADAIYPAWSPDGKRLYYVLTTPSEGSGPTTAVWRIALDGGSAERRLWDKELHLDGPLGIDMASNQLFARTRDPKGTRAFLIDLATWRIESQFDWGLYCVQGVAALGADSRHWAYVNVQVDEALKQQLMLGETCRLSLEPEKGSIRAVDFDPEGKSLVIEIKDGAGKSNLHVVDSIKGLTPLTTDGVSGDPAWFGR